MLTLSDILVIIVAYHPADDILKQCQKELRYIIVDNSESPDPTLPERCALNKNCHYVALGDNQGIAKAFNIGCEYAIAHGYQWVVTMDQDSEMSLDILQKMLNFANCFPALNKTAIISPRHVLQHGRKIKVNDERDEYQEGLGPMASGNLLNLDVWQKISGFDNELFIDMVDLDYYCKAMAHGYKVITLNHVEMPHKLGNIEARKILHKSISVLHHNPTRKYYQVRNSLILIKRYQSSLTWKELKKLTWFLFCMFVGTVLYEKDKIKKVKSMARGAVDFLRGKTGKHSELRGQSGK